MHSSQYPFGTGFKLSSTFLFFYTLSVRLSFPDLNHHHTHMLLAASDIYEHPDFTYSPYEEWHEWKAKVSTTVRCAGVSAIALVAAGSTFAIYKVTTIVNSKSLSFRSVSVSCILHPSNSSLNVSGFVVLSTTDAGTLRCIITRWVV